MNPFFFGRSTRQLFGAYEPAIRSTGDGVVLCPPFGEEYLHAHGTYRLLARQLSAANLDVLRFDYFGTGDSAGEFEDADAEQWMSDIGTAIMELKDISQVSRIALVGLRYGGTLAALAARTRSDVDRLVLWDAIFDGPAYLTEIGAAAAVPDQTVDARGVSVTPRLRDEMASVTLNSFAAPLPRTMVVNSAPIADSGLTLAGALTAQGVDVRVEHVPDVPPWGGSAIGPAAMPVAAMRRIVAWLA